MQRFIRYIPLVLVILIFTGGASYLHAQVDDDPMFPERKKDQPPRGIQESLIKMRIEKDKKDFNDMVKRGEDAAKLAASLKADSISDQQDQIASLTKLVKKIRDELGAEGSIDADDTALPGRRSDVVKALKDAVNGLSDELKKCTRFTVSAAAINRTNEILFLIKHLHG